MVCVCKAECTRAWVHMSMRMVIGACVCMYGRMVVGVHVCNVCALLVFVFGTGAEVVDHVCLKVRQMDRGGGKGERQGQCDGQG